MSLITPLLEKTPASNQNAIIPATHSLDSLIKNLPSLALPDFTVQGSFTKIRTIGNNINLISAQSILIFNLDTKTESSLDFQTDSTVKFSPNKKFLLTFSNSYGSKKIWDVDKKQELGLITTKYNINSYVFSSDSRYLLISTYEIFMYDLIGKQHVKTFGPQEDENKPFIKNLRLIEDDQTVVTFSDELIKL